MRRELLLVWIMLAAACGEDLPERSLEPRVPQTIYVSNGAVRPDKPDEHGSWAPKVFRTDKVTLLVPQGFEDEVGSHFTGQPWMSDAWPGIFVTIDTLAEWELDRTLEMPCVWKDGYRRGRVPPLRIVSQLRSDGMVGLCLEGSQWSVVKATFGIEKTFRCTVDVPAGFAPYALKLLDICKSMRVEPCRGPATAETPEFNPATCLPDRR